MKPRSADMEHTSSKAGAMVTKPDCVAGFLERTANWGLNKIISSMAMSPSADRKHKAMRKVRLALRGSSRASE